MRKCSVCKLEKEDITKNGKCKKCNTEYMKEYRKNNSDKTKKYNKEYREKNLDKLKQYDKEYKIEYYKNNKEEILLDMKIYYQENKKEKQEYNKTYYENNREKLIIDAKEYYEDNKERVKEYHNEYYKNKRINDINFKIKTSISANISFRLKNLCSSKGGKSCLNYLPYTMEELRQHLENKFEWWMNWENYGKYIVDIWDDNDPKTWVWQIDHIIPHSTFYYTTMNDEEFRRCWALSNLRPLSAKQNFLDGVKRIRHIK